MCGGWEGVGDFNEARQAEVKRVSFVFAFNLTSVVPSMTTSEMPKLLQHLHNVQCCKFRSGTYKVNSGPTRFRHSPPLSMARFSTPPSHPKVGGLGGGN